MIVNKINLHSVLEPAPVEKRKSVFLKIASTLRKYSERVFAEPEMTFEQWERIERKYSPHSSHHAQIYFRERGL